ncbi:MAG: ribonuclease J [Peptostreptococcus sp.]|uniref:ribonuclease J n=1 Tax=Peptostreptococcus TaxID=1257 RepID=UPI001D096E5D|nr:MULTISPECIES: ribonuclease J [Peptostreptococcus]MCB6983361.1 ribonuclease J [Peptostreptococcus anaerobius]MCQ5151227.1 ribonuclease J [Peptostreptococcus anaerobius]MDB8850033.1 ribonuclease J [Peptostreptococcus anaerobius]MDB8853765.1 ribonuclease J [Peptostreptococcus anaerobius]MDB8855553.1 ribonuclease J [Peptostreptococcus anaerobius]
MSRNNNDKIKIIPLGGLNEIGKNMTLIEYKDEIIVIDAGLCFPEDELLGIDIVIPDITYLEKNIDKVKGIFITHGHEDHIGAMPYILKKINVPVYGSALSMELVKVKLKEHRITKAKLNTVGSRDQIKLKHMSVEFIRVNHSIPDAYSIAVHTNQGVIYHTGDFKIDLTPIDGEMMDIHRICQISDEEGILLMMADSTNADKPGSTMSEKSVGAGLDDLFKKAQNSRIIVATFASNIHRLQQIADAAKQYGRKVAVSGRSMVNILGVAKDLGYLTTDEHIIDLNDIHKYKDEELVIITTGSQGEPMSALARMANSEHKKVEIKKGDLVIISAHPIPGNEKTVSKIINFLLEKGAEVVSSDIADIHVSGHARQDELKLMQAFAKPKFFLPVHGEYKMLKRHAELAKSVGTNPDNIFIISNGDILEVDRRSARKAGRVASGRILIDGLGVGDVGNIVLRDRKHLSEDGLMTIVVTLSKEDGRILAGPDIISRGFVYVRESEGLMDGAKAIINNVFEQCESKNIKEWAYIKNTIKEELKDYLYIKTKRNPMILPILMEV